LSRDGGLPLGERQHQVMNTLAGRLGDEEIAALAAYFLSENN
jgi:cytochrome c553